MKHIFLNLKRFDIKPELGGVNRLAEPERWGEAVTSSIKEVASRYADAEFAAFLPEAHLTSAVAGAEGSPLGVGCQHDVGCAKGCVVHIPVRGRIPVDGNDVVGIVENVVGVPSEPLLVLRKPGKLCQAGTQPGLDLGGQGLYALPALKNDKAPGLHAGSCGGLRAKAQEFVDGIFGNRPVLVGTAGSAGTYALQGVHELHSFVFCCIQGR